MISIENLKQFVILGYLTDDMLKKLVPITEILMYDKNEMVFKQGGKAERFYLLKKGKVLLEQRISDTITISLRAIKPGFSLGWSAMLEDDVYSSDAICTEPCEMYSFREAKIKRIMEQDHSLGFIISQRLLYVMKKRYNTKTQQFVKTVKLQPEISDLL